MINKKEGKVTPGKWFPIPSEIKRQSENKNIFESAHFKECCEKAEAKVTKRQAVKFKNERGKAYSAA